MRTSLLIASAATIGNSKSTNNEENELNPSLLNDNIKSSLSGIDYVHANSTKPLQITNRKIKSITMNEFTDNGCCKQAKDVIVKLQTFVSKVFAADKKQKEQPIFSGIAASKATPNQLKHVNPKQCDDWGRRCNSATSCPSLPQAVQDADSRPEVRRAQQLKEDVRIKGAPKYSNANENVYIRRGDDISRFGFPIKNEKEIKTYCRLSCAHHYGGYLFDDKCETKVCKKDRTCLPGVVADFTANKCKWNRPFVAGKWTKTTLNCGRIETVPKQQKTVFDPNNCDPRDPRCD